jgi:Fuc2NAc and GlcNAc transferase
VGLIILVIAGSVLLSASGAIIVYKYGYRIGLIDVPNMRSSHASPTPSSGGLGIWLTLLVIECFVTKNYAIAVITCLIGLSGLLDDRFNLSPKIRLAFQLAVSSVAVYIFSQVPDSIAGIFVFLFWIVFVTGTMNFYNFMDGINGIAALTGLVAFSLLAYFAYFMANDMDIALMSIAMSAGCLGFLPFNFPKSKVFMGDVGSLLLGFIFALFVVKFSRDIYLFVCLVMFLSTFYADAVVTIFYRWKRGENLMQAHRSHLYQHMSNEWGLSHWVVSLLYAIIQLGVGLLSLFALEKGLIWQLAVFAGFGIFFMVSYKWVINMKPSLR